MNSSWTAVARLCCAIPHTCWALYRAAVGKVAIQRGAVKRSRARNVMWYRSHSWRPRGESQNGNASHSAPAMANTVYDNGPYNGTNDAWTINFGFSVSDSFTAPSNSQVQGLSLVYWDASASDLLTTVDMQIGSTSFGGSTQTLTGVTNTFLTTNQFGYNLYQADYSFGSIPWAGAGFVTLSNACTNSGCSVSTPIYWDENSGPSTAYENT